MNVNYYVVKRSQRYEKIPLWNSFAFKTRFTFSERNSWKCSWTDFFRTVAVSTTEKYTVPFSQKTIVIAVRFRFLLIDVQMLVTSEIRSNLLYWSDKLSESCQHDEYQISSLSVYYVLVYHNSLDFIRLQAPSWPNRRIFNFILIINNNRFFFIIINILNFILHRWFFFCLY
jgi:hypothetical protein